VLALNAISVTVIYGTVRALNLAHGDTFALTTVVITTLIRALGVQRNSPALILIGALALTVIAAALFGLILSVGIERAAFRPFRGRSRLAPLIATLGISFILFQGALIWRTLQPSWVPHEHRSVPGLSEVPTDGIPPLLPDIDLVQTLGINSTVKFHFTELVVLASAIGGAVGVSVILKRTAIGRAIRACSQDPQLAQICGVDLNRTIRRAFAFGGVLVGLAAFIFVLYYTRPFGDGGAQSGLLAFAAAILGGIGSPIGALISALSFGVLSSFSDFFLSAQWTPVLMLALMIGLLVLRPTGLAGESAAGDADSTQRDTVLLIAPGRRTRLDRWLIVILIGLAFFPALSAAFDLGWQILVRGIGLYILLSLGLNLLLGVAGVLDLGYAISFAIGGYTAALMTNRYGDIGSLLPQPIDFLIVLAMSMVLAALFGVIKGALALRLRSDYLAVATLALGLLVRQAIVNLRGLTGGVGGIGALPAPTILTVSIDQPGTQYYLVAVGVMVAAVLSVRLIRSRTGRAWLASSSDETAAAAFGINVPRQRLLAFTLSSALAGLAGALYAGTFAFVSPDMAAFHVTALVLTMVVLGGAGSVPGVILGAMLIISYDQIILPRLAALIASLAPPDAAYIGAVPDIRGISFFNFGIALYLTVLFRARRRDNEQANS
ncbi:MAG TPA: ABC transporter permease, partial [Anaerolineae bacterium]|nr:ABC transporter permease [Anaerolineae bacterium]